MRRLLVAMAAVVLMAMGCSGADDARTTPPDQPTAVDRGDHRPLKVESDVLETHRTAAAAVPGFVVRHAGHCRVARRVVPPSSRIDGLRWLSRSRGRVLPRISAAGEFYRVGSPGRWRVSLTIPRGNQQVHVGNVVIVEC